MYWWDNRVFRKQGTYIKLIGIFHGNLDIKKDDLVLYQDGTGKIYHLIRVTGASPDQVMDDDGLLKYSYIIGINEHNVMMQVRADFIIYVFL